MDHRMKDAGENFEQSDNDSLTCDVSDAAL
jgi:hypothetical protein